MRKVKQFRLSEEILLQALEHISNSNLPSDAKIIDINIDNKQSGTVSVNIISRQYPAIPELADPPVELLS